jgi:hypothetical protein
MGSFWRSCTREEGEVGSSEVNREKKKLQEKQVSRFFSSGFEEPKTKFINLYNNNNPPKKNHY